MSRGRGIYEKDGLYVESQDEWQMWEGGIYYYEYKYEDRDGYMVNHRAANIHVPVQIVDYLGLKNKDKIMIAIKRKVEE